MKKLLLIISLTIPILLPAQDKGFTLIERGGLGEGNSFYYCGGLNRLTLDVFQCKWNGNSVKFKGQLKSFLGASSNNLLIVKGNVVDSYHLEVTDTVYNPAEENSNLRTNFQRKKLWEGEFSIRTKLEEGESIFFLSIGSTSIELQPEKKVNKHPTNHLFGWLLFYKVFFLEESWKPFLPSVQ